MYFVAYFASTKGTPLATYVNFALHLDTVGGMEVSADYPATTATSWASQGCRYVDVYLQMELAAISIISMSQRSGRRKVMRKPPVSAQYLPGKSSRPMRVCTR